MNWPSWRKLTRSSAFLCTTLIGMSVRAAVFHCLLYKLLCYPPVYFTAARFRAGQNLAIQYATQPFWRQSWPAMIADWYNEVIYVDRSAVMGFPCVSIFIFSSDGGIFLF